MNFSWSGEQRTKAQLNRNVSLKAVGNLIWMWFHKDLTICSIDTNHIIWPPYRAIKQLDTELLMKIAKYLAQVLGKCESEVKCHLSPQMAAYHAGKLRIQNGGDNFHTKQTSHQSGALAQRNCYSDSKNPFNVCLKHSVRSVTQSGVGISLHSGGVKGSIYPWLQIGPWVMWFGWVAVEIWAIWNANTIPRVFSLLNWIGYLDVISTWYSLLLL